MKNVKDVLTYFLLVVLAVCLLLGGAKESHAKKTLVTIAGAGVGGIWYTLAGGMSELINKNLPDVTASAQATGAAVENLRLLEAKSVDFGMWDTGTSYKAIHGMEPFTKPIRGFGSCGVMFSPVTQVIIKKKQGVTSFAELKGKKIAAGALGSGTWGLSILVFPELGIDREDLIPLGYRAANDAFKDGRIDAIHQQGGYPFPNLSELATSYDVEFIQFTEEEHKRILEKFPQIIPYTIPAGVYRGQDKPIRSIATVALFGAREDTPEDLVYRVTKVIYSEKGLDYMKKVHSILKPLTVENVLEWAMGKQLTPLHPGAIKYYKELAKELGKEWKPSY